MDGTKLKEKVIRFRRRGKTYSEIQKILKVTIPKSTLSYWCKNIPLPRGFQRRILAYNKFNLKKARQTALAVNKAKRENYFQSILDRNKHLAEVFKNRDVGKIALAMLYLGEGAKNRHGSLFIGNSDSGFITLFLHLLRYCYKIDESRFRCTVQCRADQDVKKLEQFWSKKTKIYHSRFYKAQIDPRTIGKRTKKKSYKGVCRIDYFSADIYNDIKMIGEIIIKASSELGP